MTMNTLGSGRKAKHGAKDSKLSLTVIDTRENMSTTDLKAKACTRVLMALNMLDSLRKVERRAGES